MSAIFGPGGNCALFSELGNKATVQAPAFVRSFGLDAYEYEAGNGITGSVENFIKIGEKAREYNIHMSLHAPYFISLSSQEEEKREKSVEYIRQSAAASDALGAKIMVVHCGGAAKLDRETAMRYSEETLEKAAEMLEAKGFSVILGLETMGKMNQLGTLDEVLRLCKISKRFAPVVDFGHINARTLGKLKAADDFKYIFDSISRELGAEYAENLHCHFSKIMYTDMGEKKHLTFEDTAYGPDFSPLAEAIVSLGVSPTIISESAGTQTKDSLIMKEIYENTENKQKSNI